MSEKILQIVATECDPAVEDRFNQWYNGVHVPLLFKYPGMTNVARYKIQGDPQGQQTYLAMYEFESAESMAAMPSSDEFKAAMAEMQESWPSGGIDIKYNTTYETLKTWHR